MANSSSWSSKLIVPLAILVSLALVLPSVLGGVICEELPQDLCTFAISSSSERCVLESYHHQHGRPTEYQCRTSEVTVQRLSDYVETDECVNSCGVDRNSVGISSDSLLEPQFTANLCSPRCYQNCPNLIDLYFNLAAGEGVFLPDLCQAQRSNPHRAMAELLSSGVVPGPTPSEESISPVASPPQSI